MADQAIFAISGDPDRNRTDQYVRVAGGNRDHVPGQDAAVSITKAASIQTYATVRFLVDRDRVYDAYRAYAYFRWIDDQLDGGSMEQSDRLAFLNRQRLLIDRLCRGERTQNLSVEEQLIEKLIHNEPRMDSGLHSYIRSMMAVMAFDAKRKGRLVSQAELTGYSRWLAVAVTEALHYFIGHDAYSPRNEARYLAATAAHITHMLRDAWEDNAAGYINVPREFLASAQISPNDVVSNPYRAWVRRRAALARNHFAAGKLYLGRVESLRCRIAGFAYIGRFESVLDKIEKDDFRLRSNYDDRKTLASMLKLCWRAFKSAVRGGDRETMTHPVTATR